MTKQLTTTGNAEMLKKNLEEQKAMRLLMDEFVQSQLKDGTDYAPAYTGSKPTLLKPGAEKTCLLLNLMPTFEVDSETHNLLSPEVKADTICYRCKLVSRSGGEVVADGRGACSIRSKRGDVNTTIKIAEKRAMLDATLRVAALSDRFTQDMSQEDKPTVTRAVRKEPIKEPNYATTEEIMEVDKAVKELGGTLLDMYKTFKVSGTPSKEIVKKMLKVLAEKKAKLAQELDAVSSQF